MSFYRVTMSNGSIVEIEATSLRGAWLYTEGESYVIQVQLLDDELPDSQGRKED